MKILFILEKSDYSSANSKIVMNLASWLKKEKSIETYFLLATESNDKEIIKFFGEKYIYKLEDLKVSKGIFSRIINFIGKITLPYFELASKIKENLDVRFSNIKFDFVVPVSAPFFLLFPFIFKKRKYKIIPFLLDPWHDNFIFKWSIFKVIFYIFELILYFKSSAIIAPSVQNNYYKNLFFGLFYKKTLLINHPLIDKITPLISQFQPIKNKVKFLFFGSFYADIRDPKIMFKTLNNLNIDYHATFFCKIYRSNDDLKALYSSSKITINEYVTNDELTSYVSNSDILINVSNLITNQFPSKLIEYINFGKPIINFVKNRHCPSIKIIENYINGLNVFEFDDISINCMKIIAFIDNFKIQNASITIFNNFFDAFTLDYVGNKIFNKFFSLIDNQK